MAKRLTPEERAQRSVDRSDYERRQDARRRQGLDVQTPTEDAIARLKCEEETELEQVRRGRQLEPAPVPDDAVARIEQLVSKWGTHAAVNALLAVLSRPVPATAALDIADATRVVQLRRRLT